MVAKIIKCQAIVKNRLDDESVLLGDESNCNNEPDEDMVDDNYEEDRLNHDNELDNDYMVDNNYDENITDYDENITDDDLDFENITDRDEAM